MNQLNNILKEKLAKINGQSIHEHNMDLYNIQKQIKHIYNLDNNLNDKLSKAIYYHDVGKCTNNMQGVLKGDIKISSIRHEYHSVSIKNLEKDIKLAILLHHKNFNKVKEDNMFPSKKYIEQQNELKELLNLEFENISDFIKYINNNSYYLKDISTILLKGYLNMCDHIGSSGVKYIDTGLNTINKYLVPKYNSIQRKVLELEDRQDILIQAMTGLGKSATSLYWSDLVQNIDKSKRIFYILPFTASINSLYKDFLNRDMSVSMLHSKAKYFLSKMTDEDENMELNELYQTYKNGIKQINICTIFQLLKAMLGCKRWEMTLCKMKNSIFIIDEVHCFNIETLCLMLEMLRWLKYNLGIHICIMSASIPTCLQKLIRDKLDINRVITPNDSDLIIRHRIHRINKDIIEDIDKIKEQLNSGKQVLICVNSVKVSQQLYELFKDDYDCKLIHGRFNDRDRELAEQGLKIAQLLIGTQSIEVSLDISYDVMFTEISPFDSLLQRFGRVNRRGEKGICDIYIYDDTSGVYNKDIINRTNQVIRDIIKEDESLIIENKTTYYLNKVYIELDMDKYNEIADRFNRVMDNLQVGNESRINISETNDSILVLPISLEDEYNTYRFNKEYLKYNSLFVGVKSNRIKWDKHIIYDSESKIYKANYEYTSKTGLDFEKPIHNI